MTITEPIKRGYLAAVLGLSLVGLVASALSAKIHAQHQLGVGGQSFCDINKELSCTAVIGSPYSYFFGVSLSAWGLAFFLGLVLLSLRVWKVQKPKIETVVSVVTLCTLLGSCFSLYLFLVSELKIKALCPLCLVVYIATLLLLVISALTFRQIGFGAKLREGLSATVNYLKILRGSSGDREEIKSARVLLLLSLVVALVADRGPALAARFVQGPSTSLTEAAKIELRLQQGALGDHLQGDVGAPILLIEFADFECGYCRMMHGVVKEELEKYPGKIAYVLLSYPLDQACNTDIKKSFHQHACYTAEFARCAGEQGKYWEAAEFLFTLPEMSGGNPSYYVRKAIDGGISQLGLDSQAFKECMESDRQLGALNFDIERARTHKIEGTPTFFINGQRVANLNPEGFRSLIARMVDEYSSR
jgi:uncharacterized membrane protein/protein-disulfide isomerase